MTRRSSIATMIFVLLVIALAFCVQHTHQLAADVSFETLTVGDVERSFRVVVPHNLGKPSPVVFAFHGTGDSSESVAAYTRLDRLAIDHGFLLIYPNGRNGVWNATDIQPDTLAPNPDVQFFDALFEHLVSRYAIDSDRVYLMGMSNGASFVQLLAHARSSTVAAVVAHSGPRPRSVNSPDRPFPILMIVGNDDFAAGSMKSDLDHYRAAGHEAELIVVEGLGHAWSIRHNADAWDFVAHHRLAR